MSGSLTWSALEKLARDLGYEGDDAAYQYNEDCKNYPEEVVSRLLKLREKAKGA